MKRLAIVVTHPIQYYAPLFRLLDERGKFQLKVFHSRSLDLEDYFDTGFNQPIYWDFDLLEGYDSTSTPPYGDGIATYLIAQIERYDPHVILFYGWAPRAHFDAMRYFHGKVPIWFRGDSTMLDETPGLRRVFRRIWLRHVYEHVDKAFYVGENNKEYFLRHGLREDQLIYAPHAVDNDHFTDSPKRKYEEDALEWRQDLKFPDDHLVVVFAGKFDRIKGPDVLIRAVQQYNRKNKKPIYLLMVGSGRMDEILERMAEDDPHIRFIGFQNQRNMPLVYRIGDVFCMPSRSDTWGLAVNEAMASGRPVIVSNKVGCASDLVDDQVGFMFTSDNEADLERVLAVVAGSDLKAAGRHAATKIKAWRLETICEVLEAQPEIS